MPDLGEWWYCVVPATASEPQRFIRVESRRHPDHARVVLEAATAREQIGDDAVCTVTYDTHGRVAFVERAASFAPEAPPLWFVEFRESTARPPAVNLVAFTGHGQQTGAVFDRSDLASLPITNADQLGAVRWYPATGEIDQIYIAPRARRRKIATALLISAGTLSLARGWPRFWGDGQRTELGEQLRNSRAAWQRSTADLTHIAPPMTPPDAT